MVDYTILQAYYYNYIINEAEFLFGLFEMELENYYRQIKKFNEKIIKTKIQLCEMRIRLLTHIVGRLDILIETSLYIKDTLKNIYNLHSYNKINYYYQKYTFLINFIFTWKNKLTELLKEATDYVNLYNQDLEEINELFNLS